MKIELNIKIQNFYYLCCKRTYNFIKHKPYFGHEWSPRDLDKV